MTLHEEFEKVLRRSEPHEQLRRLVLVLASRGQSQQQVFEKFEQFRAHLRKAGRERDEDLVLDTMDCICGWCSPRAKLFDSQPQ